MSLDAKILKALRGAGSGSLSGGDLAQQFGVTRAAIWARIQELRSLGYQVDASAHGGYRLISAPDLLHADDLVSRLPGVRVIGRDIQVFQETTSTNDVVEKMARDGVGEGVVVFAEKQTKGRGRLGRAWLSPGYRGLWFSVLLRPSMLPQEVTRITILAAAALARAIAGQTKLDVEIKWPNDLLLRGRKFGGILMELGAEPDRINHVVLGIGLDVNLAAGEFPLELRKLATSLRLESGQPVNRAELAVRILLELDRDYERLNKGGFSEIAEEWEQLCSTLGREVTIRMGPRVLQGRAEALDSDGALLLRTQHGHLERVLGGDVTLREGNGQG
jgi:BirA family transcriptional regulator, biotin operon repressor / biotin---[acetyl-CoA-carboxylase] ligase